MKIEIQGEGTFEVPDDATPEEIAALTQPKPEKPTQASAALTSGAHGFTWGTGPRLQGLYAAGEGQYTGAPLETAGAVLSGLWRKIRGDPEALKREQETRQAEMARLEAAREAWPKTSLVSEVGGGALSPVAKLAPFRGGASLLGRSTAGAGNASLGAGLYGLASSPEETVGGQLGDALRAASIGAPIGAAAPAVASAVQSAAARMSPAVRGWAERAAVRSTNADRTAARRAFKGNEGARQKLGAFLLDEPAIKLRSPKTIREGALAAQEVYGPAIGKMAQAADELGAKVDLKAAVDAAKSSRAIADLSKNTVTKAKFDEVVGMLEDQIARHGEKVPPSVAHDVRIQLDRLSAWDQTAPAPVKEAWRAARKAVDSKIDDAMQGLELKQGWDYLNNQFSQARKLANPNTQRGLADIGAERRVGNRYGSPSEKAAAIVGTSTALLGNPAGLGMPLAMAGLNRAGFPVAARGLNALSQRLAAPSVLEQATKSPALAAIMAQRLRLRAPMLELAPAVGEDTGP